MKLIEINSNGGTCDRCGKGLVNVAVISNNGINHTIGLDCLLKVEALDFDGRVTQAVKDARKLAIIRRLNTEGKLQSKFKLNSNNEKIWYWLQPKKGWQWLGLERQNTQDLSLEILKLVSAVK